VIGLCAAAEGEDWQSQRRAAAPAFRPSAVAENLAAFADATSRITRDIQVGQPIELSALVARIIADIVFTVLVKCRVDGDAVARDVPPYVRRIANFSAIDLLPLPEAALDQISGYQSDPVVKRMQRLAKKIVDDRAGAQPAQDMIAMLEGVGSLEDNIR
jgi:cytochrome P450